MKKYISLAIVTSLAVTSVIYADFNMNASFSSQMNEVVKSKFI